MVTGYGRRYSASAGWKALWYSVLQRRRSLRRVKQLPAVEQLRAGMYSAKPAKQVFHVHYTLAALSGRGIAESNGFGETRVSLLRIGSKKKGPNKPYRLASTSR
jgi:hypothetical protein